MSKVNRILYRNNIPFDESYKKLLTDYNFYQIYKKDSGDLDNYSSYNNFQPSEQEFRLIEYCNKFYKEVTSDILKQLNLRVGSECDFNYWWQLYNNQTTGHGDHTHFGPSVPVIFSFVHFINMDKNDPCFHFVNEDGTGEYINEESNDFVLFGSWTRHRVKQPTSKEIRAVIAGNISINKHICSRQYY